MPPRFYGGIESVHTRPASCGHPTMLGMTVVLWKAFAPKIEAWVFEGVKLQR